MEWIPRIRSFLIREGMNYRDMVMVAWAMGEEGMSYKYAVEAYAEYIGCKPQQIHAGILRRLAAKELRISPEDYMTWVVQEVATGR